MHKSIKNGEAFELLKELGYPYRRRLYEKINDQLSFSRSAKTIKNWFLRPAIYIPKKHFEYYHSIMLTSLEDVLNEALHDLHYNKKELDELTCKIEDVMDVLKKGENVEKVNKRAENF